jgi:hypothetical protein
MGPLAKAVAQTRRASADLFSTMRPPYAAMVSFRLQTPCIPPFVQDDSVSCVDLKNVYAQHIYTYIYVYLADKIQGPQKRASPSAETCLRDLTISTSSDNSAQKRWYHAQPELWSSNDNVSRNADEAADTLADLPVISPSSSKSPYGSPRANLTFDALLYTCPRTEVSLDLCVHVLHG